MLMRKKIFPSLFVAVTLAASSVCCADWCEVNFEEGSGTLSVDGVGAVNVTSGTSLWTGTISIWVERTVSEDWWCSTGFEFTTSPNWRSGYESAGDFGLFEDFSGSMYLLPGKRAKVTVSKSFVDGFNLWAQNPPGEWGSYDRFRIWESLDISSAVWTSVYP
jgi:hypothetical protein